MPIVCSLIKEYAKLLRDWKDTDLGGTYCYRGKVAYCIWDEHIDVQFKNPKAQVLIKKCIKEHEIAHSKQRDCTKYKPEEDLCYGAEYPPQFDTKDERECDAYKVELKCLYSNLGTTVNDNYLVLKEKIAAYCENNDTCIKDINNELKSVQRALIKRCAAERKKTEEEK